MEIPIKWSIDKKIPNKMVAKNVSEERSRSSELNINSNVLRKKVGSVQHIRAVVKQFLCELYLLNCTGGVG